MMDANQEAPEKEPLEQDSANEAAAAVEAGPDPQAEEGPAAAQTESEMETEAEPVSETDSEANAEAVPEAEVPELPSMDVLQAAMAEVRMATEDAELPESPPFRVENLDRHIEALVFTADSPVQPADVVDALNRAHGLELDPNVVRNHLETLTQKYADAVFPFQVVESGGGYRFMSKVDYHESISYFLNLKSKRRLSRAAMETLAIIAYRQPVSKSEVENIRGVSCDYSIQKLLEKELIEITGRADSPGKPLLYGTSPAFMDHFGINSTEDLPKLKEFEQAGQELGISPEALDPEQLGGVAPMPEAPEANGDGPDIYGPESSADVPEANEAAPAAAASSDQPDDDGQTTEIRQERASEAESVHAEAGEESGHEEAREKGLSEDGPSEDGQEAKQEDGDSIKGAPEAER